MNLKVKCKLLGEVIGYFLLLYRNYTYTLNKFPINKLNNNAL